MNNKKVKRTMSERRPTLEKGLHDLRFRRNEDSILKVFIAEGDKGTSTRAIAKKAGVSRAAVYIHHRTIKEIIKDYQEYIPSEFQKQIQNKLKRPDSKLRALYFDLLVFILKNRQIFEMFLKFNHQKTINLMIKKLESEIVKHAHLPKNYQRIFRIYTGEIVELITIWSETGFSEKELGKTLDDIMYLTDTARTRLMPLARPEDS